MNDTNEKQPEMTEPQIEKNDPVEIQQPKSEIELLQEKIADLELQIVQFKDQMLRKAAEFENYKRRIENDNAQFIKYSSEAIILQMLPVLDDLIRTIKNGKESLSDDPFFKGVEIVHAKFVKALEAQGVKALETKGKEFNVDFHDALLQVPRNDVPPHTIVEEVEKGYQLYDKVIRHAKVIVSSQTEEEEVKK